MNRNTGGIFFRNINVNVQSSNTGVFIGGSKCHGWRIKEKENTGFGPIYNNYEGESSSLQNINYIMDRDCIDTYKNKYKRVTS